MKNSDIITVIEALKEDLKAGKLPIVSELAEKESTPFQILISTLLSLRTKDEVTELAASNLFALASTPSEMLKFSEDQISAAIYPVGFYRNKSKTILQVSKELVERYRSQVPDSIEELLKFKGVGRKTANLVVTLGYGGEGICVDTHVHRISNRLGYVRTKTPEETEFVLREKLSRKYWTDYNTIMVAFGRNICRPVSPFCSQCPVCMLCEK
ncbi:MAG: endonuclease III, partial [Thermodesulfobacteriota bacterium]|nr:endonuclease III [Thermodesulfobacteriota bacterium]